MDASTAANTVCRTCHDEGLHTIHIDADLNGAPARDVEQSPWKPAPKVMSFANKDAPTLCQEIRANSGLNAEVNDPEFMRHVAEDELIGFGFEGLRGITANSPEGPLTPEPPPMSRTEFVAAAQRWLDEGHAKCGGHGWSGSIVQRTSLRSVSPGSDLATDLTIIVNVNGGSSTASVHMVGHTIQDGATVSGCQTYNHEAFSADGTVPAEVEIVVTPPLPSEDMPAMPPGFALPPGVPDPGEGGYLINFVVPHLVPGSHHIETQSVTLPPRSACQRSVQDPPYSYAPGGGAIMNPLGADQPDHLVGTDTQTADGSTVMTSWDLSLD